MIYDYIIVGAGIGGLSAGLNLVKNNKNVLILEKNSLPGGLISTFKRGRFEFDVSLYDLYDYGNEEHRGSIQKLLEKYEITLDTTLIPIDAKIKVIDSNETYKFRGDIDAFIIELEKLKTGSIDTLKEFIKITKEVHDALVELQNNNKIDEEKYPNFYKYLEVNVIDALNDLKMPKETIHRLGFLWLYLGSPLNKLSFIDFADFMYKFIFKKQVILNNKNIDLALKMTNKFQELGGNIYYRANVSDINCSDEIKIVTTCDGKKYKAKNVICNLSQRYVYKNLIKNENKDINKLENARTLSMNGVVIYLGLNKNHSEIGLNHYKYYQFQNINSEINIKNMNDLYHHTWEAIVPNVVNQNASPFNTTILILKTNYFGKPFDSLNKLEYNNLKQSIARDLIEQFESAFKIDIQEYIEEMEIATPLTFSRYTNNVNGSMKGYMRLGYDNAIHRLISYEEEKNSSLSFVGGSSVFGAGVDNAIHSGYYVTNKLLEEGEVDE